MEDLSESLARCFTTRPGEEEEIPVDDKPNPTIPSGGVRNLVGRVVSQKTFSGVALKMHISRLLQLVRGFTYQDLGENKFVFRFNRRLDCEHAMEGY